jgi:SAM-dependent methyltransferase
LSGKDIKKDNQFIFVPERTITVDDDKVDHYTLIKNFFRENVEHTHGYYEAAKHDPRQQKIFKLCLSLLDDITQHNCKITSAIDIGCGMGSFTFESAERFPQIKKVVGIDFLKEVIEKAQEKTKTCERVSFILGDILHLPFRKRAFDVSLCIDTLHHIHQDDFGKAIAELARITDKYLILEIRNRKNVFHFWYAKVMQPMFYKNLPVFTTSIGDVNDFIRPHQFQLESARRIEHSKWNCRRLILVYKRTE